MHTEKFKELISPFSPRKRKASHDYQLLHVIFTGQQLIPVMEKKNAINSSSILHINYQNYWNKL